MLEIQTDDCSIVLVQAGDKDTCGTLFNPSPHDQHQGDTSHYERTHEFHEEPTNVHFKVLKEGQPVGAIALLPRGVDARIDFIIDDAHTGNGYASIATKGLTHYLNQRYALTYGEVGVDNTQGIGVLERSGFISIQRTADTLIYIHNENAEIDSLPYGVMKKIASNGTFNGARNSHTYDGSEVNLNRLISGYAGKKNRILQSQLRSAIEHIAQHPGGDGSSLIQGLGSSGGKGSPTFNHSHVNLLRFKPSEAQHKTCKMNELRDIRIVYGILGSRLDKSKKAIGILDIIHRGDFGKKYN